MDRDFITVSEYAAIKGISKQRVYQRITRDLQEYVQIIDGKKTLSVKTLTESELKRLEQHLNKFEQPLNKFEQPPTDNLLLTQIAEKDKQIERLLQQIEEKDKQIDNLLRQLENTQTQNGKLTDIINNSQILLAAEKKMFIAGDGNTPKGKKGIFGIFKRQKGNETE